MKKYIQLFALCAVAAGLALAATGCGKEEDTSAAMAVESTARPKPTATPGPSPAPTDDLTNKAINSLTGLYVDKDAAVRRPVAVVINNLHKAKPQSGISQADIMYEVLAEGDITRMVAIFRDFDSARIGPVRSARHYFLDFALDNDAIFTHHGGSPMGYGEIGRLNIDNLDGMREAETFWRDPERSRVPSMYEHSSYTNAENILRDIAAKGYRAEVFEDAETPFNFYEEQTHPENRTRAVEVSVPFSDHYTRRFVYNAKARTYSVFQGEDSHVDEETGEQLSVSNVIVQYVTMYVIAGDDNGRREVKLVGEGDGLLITNGVASPITWKKEAHKEPTRWFDEAGNKLTINKGKTWINVFMGEVDLHPPEEAAEDAYEG